MTLGVGYLDVALWSAVETVLPSSAVKHDVRGLAYCLGRRLGLICMGDIPASPACTVLPMINPVPAYYVEDFSLTPAFCGDFAYKPPRSGENIAITYMAQLAHEAGAERLFVVTEAIQMADLSRISFPDALQARVVLANQLLTNTKLDRPLARHYLHLLGALGEFPGCRAIAMKEVMPAKRS